MKRGPLLVMLLLLPRSSLPLSPASSSSTAFLSSFQPLGGLRVPVQQATWGRAGVGISLKEGRRQGCGPWPRARPINALHTSRRMANGVSVESHLYSVWEANVSVSPRQSLDSSLSMLERHLASMQLQLEWLHADSRYALCLALAMQLSSSNQSFFSSDIAASAAQIRQMIDRANHNSNRDGGEQGDLVSDMQQASRVLSRKIVHYVVSTNGFSEFLYTTEGISGDDDKIFVASVGPALWSTRKLASRDALVATSLLSNNLGDELSERLIRAKSLGRAVQWLFAARQNIYDRRMPARNFSTKVLMPDNQDEATQAQTTGTSPTGPGESGKHFVLLDSSGIIFRSFYGVAALSRSDGQPTNAVFGFCRMLQHVTMEMFPNAQIIAVFDHPEASFRSTIWPSYKGNRPEIPQELKSQFDLVKDAATSFDIPVVEVEGFEADDIIATLAARLADLRHAVTIVSSDKDLYQLVSDKVGIWDPFKKIRVDREGVIQKFGVPPEKVVDVQSLAGDATDNIPGIPGIGLKTAAKLVNEFGSLDSILERASEIKQDKRREAILSNAEAARVGRQLVTLRKDVPIDNFQDLLKKQNAEVSRINDFLKMQGFASLMNKNTKKSREVSVEASEVTETSVVSFEESTEESSVEVEDLTGSYDLLTETEHFDFWIEEAKRTGMIAIEFLLSSPNPQVANVTGIAMAVQRGRAAYIPIGHDDTQEFQDAFQCLELEDVLQKLSSLFSDPSVLKITSNAKSIVSVLQRDRRGLQFSPFDDVNLLSFCLDSGKLNHDLDELTKKHLNAHIPELRQILQAAGITKRTKIKLESTSPSLALKHAAAIADAVFRLHGILQPRLARERVSSPYELMERPLVPVLARMEACGVLVDRKKLEILSQEYARRVSSLEDRIYRLAKKKFLIASPKQLAQVFFQELKLPRPEKKGKSGDFSTSSEVLEDLAKKGYEIASYVNEWRYLTKLKSTYTDGLIRSINPRSGRVHTSFCMAATATGRLSSVDPNLQNIPNTGEGKTLRDAFVAAPGWTLLSADYSQIELRLLAHMAEVDTLREAFHNNIDVHRLTASQVFGIPEKSITDELRRRAKAINFGIIYGQSAFGLSKQLDISVKDAKTYIDSYFKQYPGIANYMNAMKDVAKEKGYVETLFGRRCHITNINSRGSAGNYAGRQAINAPIQGTAADIIKRAMLRIETELEREGVEARMLLQVHDELVFEVREGDEERAGKIVKRVMEDACSPTRVLSVPLVVDIGVGTSWGSAH
uniref:DNA-directed DNA polymerase n=1 Tax=Hanusia phi TaxID=3032 RepID=A0A7S0HFB4_9CRYP